MAEKNLGEILRDAKSRLHGNGISTWALDAELILSYVTGLRKEQLITHDRNILSEKQLVEFEEAINKRLKAMPVQYIIKRCEFMGLDFYVDEHVLIPRADTEILVEAALGYINERSAGSVLDICTGSGAIATALAKYCPCLKRITASDISAKALAVASKNAENNGAGEIIEFAESDLLQDIIGRFDVIVSNPPYIRQADIETLGENVKAYEPLIALSGGEDGLFFYRKMAEEIGFHLNDKGRIFLEIGYDQAEDVTKIFEAKDFNRISLLKDLAGLDRTLIFSKNI